MKGPCAGVGLFGRKRLTVPTMIGRFLLPALLLGSGLAAGADAAGRELETDAPAYVYAANEGEDLEHGKGVAALLEAWEAANGPIEPGPTGRVVLKVYTNSGLGLRTPPSLVLALAEALERRGFERRNIVVADLEERRLRAAGYLPPLSEGGRTFRGMPVVVLDDPERFLPDWHYDSPLPPDPLLDADRGGAGRLLEGDEDRKSFLPAPLLFDLDFWINLPVAVEHPVLGLSGAVANAGLWAVSNQARFFRRPVSAASSAVEIAAIPELRRTWLFSLLTLERYQIIGGPRFDSHYTHGRAELLLSDDPLLVDRYALAAVNASRLERGFDPILPEPLFFRYGESLGLGSADLDPARLRFVGPGDPEGATAPATAE